jgi:Uma2 family endonuclease
MAQLMEIPAQAHTTTVRFYTEQEYLERERSLSKEDRHEFINGNIVKIGGASLNHNTIFTNLFLALGLKMQEKDYRLYPSDMRVNNPVSGSYFYPDITVVRGEPLLKYREFDNLLNPCLIIEIISPGTEEYDRVDKFTAYQSILTLEEYALVASDRQQVEYFRREAANQWQKILYSKAEDILHLLNGELIVTMADIYRNVKLQ